MLGTMNLLVQATTCTEEKVTELDLSVREQPIWEPAIILKRGFTKPKQIPAVMLWMTPAHEGLQALSSTALSKTHTNKRAAISKGTASLRSGTRSVPGNLDTKCWLCGREGSEITRFKPCFFIKIFLLLS